MPFGHLYLEAYRAIAKPTEGRGEVFADGVLQDETGISKCFALPGHAGMKKSVGDAPLRPNL